LDADVNKIASKNITSVNPTVVNQSAATVDLTNSSEEMEVEGTIKKPTFAQLPHTDKPQSEQPPQAPTVQDPQTKQPPQAPTVQAPQSKQPSQAATVQALQSAQAQTQQSAPQTQKSTISAPPQQNNNSTPSKSSKKANSISIPPAPTIQKKGATGSSFKKPRRSRFLTDMDELSYVPAHAVLYNAQSILGYEDVFTEDMRAKAPLLYNFGEAKKHLRFDFANTHDLISYRSHNEDLFWLLDDKYLARRLYRMNITTLTDVTKIKQDRMAVCTRDEIQSRCRGRNPTAKFGQTLYKRLLKALQTNDIIKNDFIREPHHPFIDPQCPEQVFPEQQCTVYLGAFFSTFPMMAGASLIYNGVRSSIVTSNATSLLSVYLTATSSALERIPSNFDLVLTVSSDIIKQQLKEVVKSSHQKLLNTPNRSEIMRVKDLIGSRLGEVDFKSSDDYKLELATLAKSASEHYTKSLELRCSGVSGLFFPDKLIDGAFTKSLRLVCRSLNMENWLKLELQGATLNVQGINWKISNKFFCNLSIDQTARNLARKIRLRIAPCNFTLVTRGHQTVQHINCDFCQAEVEHVPHVLACCPKFNELRFKALQDIMKLLNDKGYDQPTLPSWWTFSSNEDSKGYNAMAGLIPNEATSILQQHRISNPAEVLVKASRILLEASVRIIRLRCELSDHSSQ
jgi:hypothetical protein